VVWNHYRVMVAQRASEDVHTALGTQASVEAEGQLLDGLGGDDDEHGVRVVGSAARGRPARARGEAGAWSTTAKAAEPRVASLTRYEDEEKEVEEREVLDEEEEDEEEEEQEEEGGPHSADSHKANEAPSVTNVTTCRAVLPKHLLGPDGDIQLAGKLPVQRTAFVFQCVRLEPISLSGDPRARRMRWRCLG
jgi:hypothetical protein